MAVADPSWWGVWWPWLLAWGITAVSLVAAVTIAVTQWRRHRAPADTRRPGISFYLDDESVMDLYRQHGGKYKAALRQEVQERSTSTSEGEVSADLAPVQARAKRGVNSEVFRSYIENAEPITVIGIIIDVLDQAGDIVHVDLRKQAVTSNRALTKAFDTDDHKLPAAVRLRGLEAFVSIRGLFHATDRTPAVTTFEAPYGEPPDPTAPADGPQIHLTCTASGRCGRVLSPHAGGTGHRPTAVGRRGVGTRPHSAPPRGFLYRR
ncbi:MAG: hypothetical protein ACRDRX_25970, partial [Pseudonocardiaceae bacterium]